MRFAVINKKEEYNLNIEQMTQLCGKNIRIKRFIIDSICKHFSSEKYMEHENIYIDNVKINDEIPGRKYFEVKRIRDKEDVLLLMQIGKNSLLSKCVGQLMLEYECQKEMQEIEEKLFKIFQQINTMLLQGNEIIMGFNSEKLVDIVQKSYVMTNDERSIYELSECELIKNLVGIIDKLQLQLPAKRLFVFGNIDHMVSEAEYKEIFELCRELTKKSDCWFLFSTSLDGYIQAQEDVLEGINVINEDVFVMPGLEHIKDFLYDNYPMEITFCDDEILYCLSRISQNIGHELSIQSISEQVIIKLINKTLGIYDGWEKEPKSAEIHCLCDDFVIK